MKMKRWLWALAALPLIYLPLAAQERKTEPAASPGTEPAPAAPAQQASDDPEAVSQDAPPPADERYTLDSNLTFPADI
jgi:hypothetical protein